jgi:hypothetical protein
MIPIRAAYATEIFLLGQDGKPQTPADEAAVHVNNVRLIRLWPFYGFRDQVKSTGYVLFHSSILSASWRDGALACWKSCYSMGTVGTIPWTTE